MYADELLRREFALQLDEGNAGKGAFACFVQAYVVIFGLGIKQVTY